ncbi:MAG: hypothetical protein BRC34_16070, partial [Cyanobacteria bacterium QH_1_48_107]
TNCGTLRFQVLEGRFTTEAFLDFLRRLVPSVLGKVFLLVDRHPVHMTGCRSGCPSTRTG